MKIIQLLAFVFLCAGADAVCDPQQQQCTAKGQALLQKGQKRQKLANDDIYEEHPIREFLPLCHISIVRSACAALHGDSSGVGQTVLKRTIAEFLATNESNPCFEAGLHTPWAADMLCADLCHRAVEDLESHPDVVVPNASDLGCTTVEGQTRCLTDLHPLAIANAANISAPIVDHITEHEVSDGTSLVQRAYRADSFSRAEKSQRSSRGISRSTHALPNGELNYASCVDFSMQIANLFRIYPTKVTPNNGLSLASKDAKRDPVEVVRTPAENWALLQEHHVKAEAWASIVLTHLNADKAAAFRQKWFGGDGTLSDDEVKTRIVKTFNFIKRELQQGFHYVFPADYAENTICGRNTLGYVYMINSLRNQYSETTGPKCSSSDTGLDKACGVDENGKYFVYICDVWAYMGDSTQIQTILHEAAHHSGPRDQSYERTEMVNKMTQEKQLDNAASYQNFGRDLLENSHGCTEPTTVEGLVFSCQGRSCRCSELYDECHLDTVKSKCPATCGQCDLDSSQIQLYDYYEYDYDATPSPDATPTPTKEIDLDAFVECYDSHVFKILWTLKGCMETVQELSSVQGNCSRAAEVFGYTQEHANILLTFCEKSCGTCVTYREVLESGKDIPEPSEDNWMNIEELMPPTKPPSATPGPTPSPTPPLHPIPAGTRARYVRILPTDWYKGSLCSRGNHRIYGPGACICTRAAVIVNSWRGEEVVDPPESERSYSSIMPYNGEMAYEAKEGADGFPGSTFGKSQIIIDRGDYNGYGTRQKWCAKHNKIGEWIHIDLGQDMDVRGVVLQGTHNSDCGMVAARKHYGSFVKAVKVMTATEDEPGKLQFRDGGKEWNTEDSEDRGIARVYFTTSVTPEGSDGSGNGYGSSPTLDDGTTLGDLTFGDYDNHYGSGSGSGSSPTLQDPAYGSDGGRSGNASPPILDDKTTPASRPASRPAPKPAPRPAPRPESRPASRPASRPEPRPASRPASGDVADQNDGFASDSLDDAVIMEDMFADAAFDKLDSSHDGVISQEEIERLDRSQDGLISRDEWKQKVVDTPAPTPLPPTPAPTPETFAAAFDRLDVSNDGLISVEELEGLDRDQDGLISREEWKR